MVSHESCEEKSQQAIQPKCDLILSVVHSVLFLQGSWCGKDETEVRNVTYIVSLNQAILLETAVHLSGGKPYLVMFGVALPSS